LTFVKASFPGLMITISGLRDYLDVRVLEEDYPVGTEVTLHLKKNQILPKQTAAAKPGSSRF